MIAPRPVTIEPMRKIVKCVFVRRVDPNSLNAEHRGFRVPRYDFRVTFECGHSTTKRTKAIVREDQEYYAPRSTSSFIRGRCPWCPEVPV